VRYFLGGVPGQDILTAILESTRQGGSWLRGYRQGSLSGNQTHLLNLEYRVPIVTIEKGLATLPFYFRRLHLAALFDAGDAFDGPFDPARLKLAVGGAVRLDMTFGFFVPGSFDVGYARGLSSGGGDELWLLLTGGL
jgi:hemolysin activation/secretion protein